MDRRQAIPLPCNPYWRRKEIKMIPTREELEKLDVKAMDNAQCCISDVEEFAYCYRKSFATYIIAWHTEQLLKQEPVAWMNTKYKALYPDCEAEDAFLMGLIAAEEMGELIPLYAAPQPPDVDSQDAKDAALIQAETRTEYWRPFLEDLERELTDARATIDAEAKDYAQTYIENQTLAAQVVQMREALNKIHGIAAPYDDGVKFRYIKEVAIEALALDTKPAEQIIAKVKAQAQVEALREAADEAYEYLDDPVLSGLGYATGVRDHLHHMANELENKE